MTIHEKQSFVTGELTALLKRIYPDVRGAAYAEGMTAAHVVITIKDKPMVVVCVTRQTPCGIAMSCLRELSQVDKP